MADGPAIKDVLMTGRNSRRSPRRGPTLPYGWSILSERVLDRNLAVPECKQVAAIDFDPLAVLLGTGECPL